MTDEHFEKRIGTVLRGKWTLERLLGVGGMAAVYVGVHRIGRRDAIKIMHPQVARSKDLRARFEQEAHAVNRLGHPGAVQIRDIDSDDDGSMFLVMELLEGEPLSDRAQRMRGLPVDEVLEHADRLLDVLAAAHDHGIIHRDIKLDNVFITRDTGLKLLDFGIAQVRSDTGNNHFTRPGSTLGTVSYMPPEQVKGMPIDPRADLFAVGATMFRLLAKRKIHEARSESELVVKMASEPAPALRSIAPEIPVAVGMIVDRALAFDRERRYPSALTMRADVQAVRRGEAPPYATAALAEPTGAARCGARSDRTAATVAPGRVAVASATDRTEHATAAPLSADHTAHASARTAVTGAVPTRTEAAPVPAAVQSATVADPSRAVASPLGGQPTSAPTGFAPARSWAQKGTWRAEARRRETRLALPPWLLGGAGLAVAMIALVWWLSTSSADELPGDEQPAATSFAAAPQQTAQPKQSERQREIDKQRQKAEDKARDKARERQKELEKDLEKRREKD